MAFRPYGINVEVKNKGLINLEVAGNRVMFLYLETATEQEIAIGEFKTLAEKDAFKDNELVKDLLACNINPRTVIISYQPADGGGEYAQFEAAQAAIMQLEKHAAIARLEPFYVLSDCQNTGTGHYLTPTYETLAQDLHFVYFTNEGDDISGQVNHRSGFIAEGAVVRLDGEIRPLYGFLAGNYVHLVGATEYGFSESLSNRPLRGIESLVSIWTTQEADQKRKEGRCVAINNGNLVMWGGECAQGSEFADVRTNVIFDALEATLRRDLRHVNDKKLDVLTIVINSITAFGNLLIANDVLIFNELSIPKELNPSHKVAAGQVVVRIVPQEMPVLKRLDFIIERTDEHSDVVIKRILGGVK